MNFVEFKNQGFGLLASLLLLSSSAVPAMGQSYQGSVRGTVTDQSGAAMTSVKITLINQGTNVARSTLSDSAGLYVFSAVDPASYQIKAESPRFKTFERSGVTVGTQQFLTVDLPMELGAASESVNVNEDAPLVESSNASQGQVIDRQQQVDLPNLGRNPFLLARVAPNVINVGPPAYNRMQDQSGSSSISVSGGPVRGNNYLLDGIPITDANNRAVVVPSIEAVQEVKIQANTYDAEMARTGGGMFNTLLKSGTNDYHGVLFGSTRQTDWSANNFFNNRSGRPLQTQQNYTYGASFGGKVWIPKVYNGKDKTFFWLAWEGYNDTQANSAALSTPTALERQGNFSQSRTRTGALNTIYDPMNLDAAGNRIPFAGNIIPSSRINPIGSNIVQTYVQPTSTAGFYGDPNVVGQGILPSHAAQYVGKLDHQVTDWWHINFSHLRYYSLEPGNTYFPTISSPDQWRLQRRVDATQVNSLFTLSPTTVLTVRYGFNRFPNYTYNASQGFNVAGLGFPSSFTNQIRASVFPSVTMNSMYGLGTDGGSFYVHASKNASANLAKAMGKHNLKAGFDYRRINAVGNDFGFSSGQFNFNGVYSRSNSGTSGTGGADLADLLLGYPQASSAFTSTKLNNFTDYYGAYIQDDFRLTSRITLNFGLRYEREYGLQESQNRLAVGLDPQAVNPLAGVGAAAGLLPRGVLQFAGQNGNPTSVGNYNLNKLGPRVGIAYQVTPKTIIRAGYGLFWAPQFAIGAPLNTPGFTATTSPNINQVVPNVSLSNPFPNGLAQPVGTAAGDLTGIGQALTLVDPYARSPRVHQFSFDIQREIGFGIALEVGYVGSRTANLTLGTSNINVNALNPVNFSRGLDALTASTPNPYFNRGGAGVVGSLNVPAYQLLRPYQAFGNVNFMLSSQNRARYDSMIVKAQKRFSHGLTFLSAFTWSKNYDASSGGAGNSLNTGNVGPQNPYDMGAEYSLSNINSPLRLTTSFTYEFPFGKNKPFLGNGKIMNAVVGGWSLNALSIYQTGFPLQISQSTNNNSQFGFASQRPSATGISPETNGSLTDRLTGYINPAAFAQTGPLAFGNVSRTMSMRGPGQANWDASLFKTFTIGERFKGQFRTALLNAFNTPLFSAPNTSLGSSTFGQITSQQNFARMIELGVRLMF